MNRNFFLWVVSIRHKHVCLSTSTLALWCSGFIAMAYSVARKTPKSKSKSYYSGSAAARLITSYGHRQGSKRVSESTPARPVQKKAKNDIYLPGMT